MNRATILTATVLGLTIGCAHAPVVEAPAPPVYAVPAAESYFALNGTKIFHHEDVTNSTVRSRLGWMRELGVQWDRSDIWWHVLEPEPGRWDFSRADAAFATLEANGIQWYPILAYHRAGWGDFEGPRTPEQLAAWSTYVEQVLTRYGNRAPVWSVWNEPNIVNFWRPEPNPADYAALLRATHEVRQRVAPNAQLAGLAIAPLGGWDRGFTERVLQAGAGAWFDIFDYHYYTNAAPEDIVARELAEIRAVLDRYDATKPIWVSEAGVSARIADKPESYDEQASLVVRNHLVALSGGVERFFYFDLQNWWDDKPDEWDAVLGLVEAGGERKPSFFAYRTMVQQVDGRDIIGRFQPAAGIEAVLLRHRTNGLYSLAAWSTAGEKPFAPALATESGTLTLFDGKMIPLAAGATTTLSHHPVYIAPVDPAAYAPHAGLRPSLPLVILTPGESRPLGMIADPALENWDIRYEGNDGAPALWAPMLGMITAADDAPPGTHRGVARWVVTPPGGGAPVTVVQPLAVQITERLSLTMRPHGETGPLTAEIHVANRVAEPLSGTLEVGFVESASGAELWVDAVDIAAIAPQGTHVVELPIPRTVARMAGAGEFFARLAGHEARPQRAVAVPRLAGPVPVEGLLDRLSSGTPISIGEPRQIVRNHGTWTPANASARVWVAVADAGLMVAADVTDQQPMNNPHAGREMWRGDGLEVYLGLGGPTRRTVINKDFEYQIGLAPTGPGGTARAFLYHRDVELDTATVLARATETGWALEALIPWEALGATAPAVGQWIGLDVTLDDVDEGDWAPAANVAGRALAWNGTGMNWINPSGWGMGLVVAPR